MPGQGHHYRQASAEKATAPCAPQPDPLKITKTPRFARLLSRPRDQLLRLLLLRRRNRASSRRTPPAALTGRLTD
jgi:hypothetical protein